MALLTPSDILNKKFEKSNFGGYKYEDVDDFLNEIISSYNEVYAEKEATEEKLEVLAEKLEEYRSNEDSIKSVLIGAQKLGDNIIRDAKAKAEVIVSEAENRVKQVYSDSESKIYKEKEELSIAKKETSEFKKKLLAMYKQHLELISLMPEDEEFVPMFADNDEAESVPKISLDSETDNAQEDSYFDHLAMDETKKIDLDIK